jgi:hypothetical protein
MKIDKWTFIKLRLSCTIKETIKKVERWWENISIIYIWQGVNIKNI